MRLLAQQSWTALDLGKMPPVQDLIQLRPWRLYLEAEGIAIYERTIAKEQLRPTTYTDLSQLVYLAVAERRILVTEDGPFFRAASSVICGRHDNTYVETWSQFRDHHY